VQQAHDGEEGGQLFLRKAAVFGQKQKRQVPERMMTADCSRLLLLQQQQ